MRSMLVACFALVACATSSAPAGSGNLSNSRKPTLSSNAGGPDAKGKYVCEFEEDTGSHLRQKVCRYLDDADDHRGQTQDWIRAQEMTGFSRPGGG